MLAVAKIPSMFRFSSDLPSPIKFRCHVGICSIEKSKDCQVFLFYLMPYKKIFLARL